MNMKQIEALYPLTFAVRRLFHKSGHGMGALHRDSDVSAGMRAVLDSVISEGPQTVPQMARVRPVTRQHIQGLVNPLLEYGYVEYIDNPAHKRSKLVSPTASGVTIFRAMRSREDEAFKRITLDVDPAEFAAATKILWAMIEVFESSAWRTIVSQYDKRAAEGA